MGLFDFLKKRPKTALTRGELTIPPPLGQPAGKPSPTYSSYSSYPSFEIEKPISAAPPPLDELEVPLPPKELELPRLEFPSLPSEGKSRSEERQPFALPPLEALEEEVPSELPDLESESKRQTSALSFPAFPAIPVPASSRRQAAPAEVLLATKEKEEKAETTEEALEEPQVVQHPGGPLYINLGGYKRVLLATEDIRDSLKKSNDRLDHMNTIKGREDSTLEAWHSSLENIQRKLIFIDRSLFEKQEGQEG